MKGLVDFLSYLYKQDNEEQLWEIWLHKPIEKGFDEFKTEFYKKQGKTKHKIVSEEEERRNIERSMEFIKPRQKGGE